MVIASSFDINTQNAQWFAPPINQMLSSRYIYQMILSLIKFISSFTVSVHSVYFFNFDDEST